MRRVDAAVAAESSATGKRRVYVANIKRYSHGMGITAVEPKSFASEVDANIGGLLLEELHERVASPMAPGAARLDVVRHRWC